MYSEVKSFEDLMDLVKKDKESTGIDVWTRDRYPIRFVLFDNFRDCMKFVDFVQGDYGAIVQSVDKWIDADYPDIMLTHTQLADCISQHIKDMRGSDCVIAPFSELARFYDNNEKKTFDALLKTIKAIESSIEAIERHHRIYLPIVGLEGKMETFRTDSQSTIWRLHSEDNDLSYRLILTDGKTFGVRGLERNYTVVNTMKEWLNIWKDADKQVTHNILCTSHSIYANAIYAQPDNAFTFVTCADAYDFLTKGLQLQFGGMSREENDGDNWETLAANIDLSTGFTFSAFVKHYFYINDIDTYETFIKLWFDNQGYFQRWLLSRYYELYKYGQGFICNSLQRTPKLTGNDLIETMALNLTEVDSEMRERSYCLREAVKRNIVMREAVQSTLSNRLIAIAKTRGETTALRYMTGITRKETELVISWLSKDKIGIEQIKCLWPDLYHYLSVPLGIAQGVPGWVCEYMKAYKRAKLSNTYTADIEGQIKTLNGLEVSFDKWYQEFSTTRTLLNGRNDIEVYYWIDGMGIEWIPLVKAIIDERRDQNIYLNDVKIARALLPTKTSVNKADLEKLLSQSEKLEKAGDLDTLAHQPTNTWPTTIIKEVELVREIIEDILARYNGKKIAIVSDHGLTYLSQLVDGIGLAGVESDHHGRIAVKSTGTWTSDTNYFRLDDGKTVCGLGHASLCNKVPKGQGIHGGCTPEEVLVPIFILSDTDSNAEWTSELLSHDISAVNPKLKFRIKNLSSFTVPVVEINGIRHELHQTAQDIFESSPVGYDSKYSNVKLIIGNEERIYKVNVDTGVQENDLFGDM